MKVIDLLFRVKHLLYEAYKQQTSYIDAEIKFPCNAIPKTRHLEEARRVEAAVLLEFPAIRTCKVDFSLPYFVGHGVGNEPVRYHFKMHLNLGKRFDLVNRFKRKYLFPTSAPVSPVAIAFGRFRHHTNLAVCDMFDLDPHSVDIFGFINNFPVEIQAVKYAGQEIDWPYRNILGFMA